MPKPKLSNNEMYQLLREGKMNEFNERKEKGEQCDFKGHDFRAIDLKEMDASDLDFSDCYFRQADLRGIDFSKSCLNGASINKASISGVLFPRELHPSEITLALEYGTRMRYHSGLCCTCCNNKH